MLELYRIAIFSPLYTQAAGGNLLTRSEAVYLMFRNLQVKVQLHEKSEFGLFSPTTLYTTVCIKLTVGGVRGVISHPFSKTSPSTGTVNLIALSITCGH